MALLPTHLPFMVTPFVAEFGVALESVSLPKNDNTTA